MMREARDLIRAGRGRSLAWRSWTSASCVPTSTPDVSQQTYRPHEGRASGRSRVAAGPWPGGGAVAPRRAPTVRPSRSWRRRARDSGNPARRGRSRAQRDLRRTPSSGIRSSSSSTARCRPTGTALGATGTTTGAVARIPEFFSYFGDAQSGRGLRFRGPQRRSLRLSCQHADVRWHRTCRSRPNRTICRRRRAPVDVPALAEPTAAGCSQSEAAPLRGLMNAAPAQ